MELVISSFLLVPGLGIPVALLTWYLFSRLYDLGHLNNEQKPQDAFKELKKRSKKEGLIDDNFLQKRWMKFGGGYYGLTALWTFVVIELSELTQFIGNFPGFDSLLADGVFTFVINVLVNQLMNVIAAFVWFTYWSELVLACLAVSYGGYLLGMHAAQRGFRFNRKTLKIESVAKS